jgi:uncharacterized protein YbbK (DUF523 family)
MQPQARDGNGQDKLRDQEAEQVRREGCSVKGGRVVGRQTGFEFTPQYEDGARKALEICRRNGITVAYLLKSSPSCGKAYGVTARLLEANGIQMIPV